LGLALATDDVLGDSFLCNFESDPVFVADGAERMTLLVFAGTAAIAKPRDCFAALAIAVDVCAALSLCHVIGVYNR
jgi:hypothetical protein